jgi:nucleoside-diphosphate-sugar epimerase
VRRLVDDNLSPHVMVHKKELPGDLKEKLSVIQGSIETFDWSRLEEGRYGMILHLARIPGRWKAGRLLASGTGRSANERLVRRLENMSRPPSLLYVAGTLAYGSCGERAVTEDEPLKPVSYAREYCRAEEPVVEAVMGGSIPGMILRAPWVLGPGSWMKRFYMEPLREEGVVPLYGDGLNWMSVIHVSDCAGMILHLARSGAPGRTYNLAPCACIRQRDFAAAIGRIAGAPVRKKSRLMMKLRHGSAAMEAFGFSFIASTSHADALRGYSFRYADLEPALKNILSEST